MSNSFFERFSALCKASGETPNSVAKRIGASSGSVTAWKRGSAPRNATLSKIADYFGVSTDYLLGKDSLHTSSGMRDIRREDIKFALFRGREDITDAMYEEVLGFADYVMSREEAKKRKE